MRLTFGFETFCYDHFKSITSKTVEIRFQIILLKILRNNLMIQLTLEAITVFYD